MDASHAPNLILLVLHQVSEELLEFYRALDEESGEDYEVRILFDVQGQPVPEAIAALPHHTFEWATLDSFGYTEGVNTFVPGLSCLPALHVAQALEGFRFFWYIEHDVRYHGSWSEFLGAFADVDADYVGAHIRNRDPEIDAWPNWDMSHPQEVLEAGEYVRSFNPIHRLSTRACRRLHELLRDGWRGHHETTYPTLLKREGFRLCDFGGTGDHTPEPFRDRFYTDGPWGDRNLETYRFRPPFPSSLGPAKGRIYHPVKAPADLKTHDLPSYVLAPKVLRWCRDTLELGSHVLQVGGGPDTRELVKCFLVSIVEHDKAGIHRTCGRYFYAPLVDGYYQAAVLEEALGKNVYEAVLFGGIPYTAPTPVTARTEFLRFLPHLQGKPFIIVDRIDLEENRAFFHGLQEQTGRRTLVMTTETGRAGVLIKNE